MGDDRRVALSPPMSSIQDQLQDELADVTWADLQPHSRRDAVIVVNESLNLVEVGIAIANDETMRVQVWIDEQLIQKPTTEQLGLWNQDPTQKFSTLIVAPYVLISRQLAGTEG
jgi:hypothetical protein